MLLAAGGFERDRELREKHQAPLTGEWSNGAPANTGDALRAGIAAGADTDLLDGAWFVPGLVYPDRLPVSHTATRGGIWVNGAGERFVNEARPYNQAGHEIVRLHATTGVRYIPAHWVFDQGHLNRDSLGGPPDEPLSPRWLESGALKRPTPWRTSRGSSTVARPGTGDRQPHYAALPLGGHASISDHPVPPGPATAPPGSSRTGAKSHTGPGGHEPEPGSTRKVMGGRSALAAYPARAARAPQARGREAQQAVRGCRTVGVARWTPAGTPRPPGGGRRRW
ncbi:FAD-binding protein [Streptomyces sp. NPDC005648]|uniref:FAD-binding protein n=1 Tax=Streptomyces sp. NPDC005648 TaxID=3157044 RepID=UPI0033A459CF